MIELISFLAAFVLVISIAAALLTVLSEPFDPTPLNLQWVYSVWKCKRSHGYKNPSFGYDYVVKRRLRFFPLRSRCAQFPTETEAKNYVEKAKEFDRLKDKKVKL